MAPKRLHTPGLIMLLLVFLAACNLPNAAPAALATDTTLPEPTQVVPSATAEPPTLTPPPPPTNTPVLPTETPTLTLTPEPSFTPTETITPTQAIPVAEVLRETNCRTGPGQMYDAVAVYQAGAKLELVAADLGGGYWYVTNPEKPGEECWIWGSNLKVEGDTTILPAFTPPSTPTPNPDFTVTFKNFDNCKGIFARFVVVNTGGFQFRSAYVKVTNLKNKEVTENVLQAFDLTTACVVAQNISPLTPGGTGYLQSEPFKKDPRSDKLSAVFMLCTEQNLDGTCITKVLEVKPK